MKPVENKDIRVEFDGRKCIHARRCVLGLPDVFRAGVTKGPWVFPDNASVEQIVEVIDQCPSGALTYHRKDTDSDEPPAKVNTARLWEDGPYEVRAFLDVKGEKATRRTLCRCGQSKNKPYCDNSHVQAGFKAAADAPPRECETPETRDGELEVIPLKDGPLMLKGPLEIIAGSGKRIAVGHTQILCRCGASENKPFCDGSHERIGFKAD